ncbi:MAG: hypothetical protein AAF624_11110 [Bacteroidota bacterium]
MRPLAVLLLVLLAPTALAQERLNLATYSVSVEVGGNAPPASVNLDVRFGDSYVLRVGGVLYLLWETHETTDLFDDDELIPVRPTFGSGIVTLSRLLLDRRAQIEIGAGVMGRSNRNEQPEFPTTAGLTGILGFRVQPEPGDFGIRVAFTPLVDRHGLHAMAGFAFLYGFP